jgi:hypothetical protein
VRTQLFGLGYQRVDEALHKFAERRLAEPFRFPI